MTQTSLADAPQAVGDLAGRPGGPAPRTPSHPPRRWRPAAVAPYAFIAPGLILFTLFLLRTSSFALGDAFRRTEATLDKMREDVIAAATERTRSLEGIGSKVAHELKNPLSAIKGLVQLLKRGAADDKSRERLGVICSEVTRMEGILRDYLSFSRPLEDLKPQPVELAR